MGTLVSFHAHPDDESIGTAGTLAKAAALGHRVVLVFATRGELGEPVPGVLADGEQLAVRRSAECHESARVLGVQRVEFLGYVDSGMIGTPQNEAPDCFWQADRDEAARRLAAILSQEQADILTIYDENGAYGHPDHIQVHRVGLRAAELAGTPRVYMNTINRDALKRSFKAAAETGVEMPGDLNLDDLDELGVAEDRITTTVDVRPWLGRKRAGMAAHASQISETSFFLAMAPEMFEGGFGQEWFIRCDAPPGLVENDLFDGLP